MRQGSDNVGAKDATDDDNVLQAVLLQVHKVARAHEAAQHQGAKAKDAERMKLRSTLGLGVETNNELNEDQQEVKGTQCVAARATAGGAGDFESGWLLSGHQQQQVKQIEQIGHEGNPFPRVK